MAEERAFSQEEVNQIVEERIARAREKWQKESSSSAETENLKAQLEAKDEEIAQIKNERFLENARRDVRAELARRGCTDQGRQDRVMKLLDFSEASDSSFALAQIDQLAKDIPELVRPRGAGSGGSSMPVLQPQQKPLTRDEVEGMSEKEINRNWDRVRSFLSGERE